MILQLDTENLSEPATKTLLETIRLAKGAHFADVELRINGEYKKFQADWIKYLEALEQEE